MMDNVVKLNLKNVSAFATSGLSNFTKVSAFATSDIPNLVKVSALGRREGGGIPHQEEGDRAI